MISKTSFGSPTGRAAFLGASAAAFAAVGISRSARAADLVPIRVGMAAVDTTAEAFYGSDNGMFRAAGFDIQLTQMRATGALAAALAGGSLDVVGGTLAPFVEGRGRGLDFRVIAPGAMYEGPPPSSPIVVSSSSKISTAAGLNGKIVAISGLRDLTNLMAVAWLDANGGDRSTVKFIEVPFPEMVAALTTGRVDAAVMVEPFVTAARNEVTIIGDPLAAIAKRFLLTGWFSKLSWLEANRETATRFVATMLKVGAWANTHQRESGAILAKYASIRPELIRSMTRGIYGTVPVTANLVQPVIDATAKYFQAAKMPASDLIWT